MFSSGLVAGFRKTPDQFLKHEAHVVVADGFGAEVGLGDLLDDFVQQVGVGQLGNEFRELKVFEDLASVFGEALDVVREVVFDVRTAQFGHIHCGCVVEGLLGGLQQKLLAGFGFQGFIVLQLLKLQQNLWLGRFQHAFQPAENRERQDHSAVLGLFEITAKEIREGPDISGCLGEVGCHIGAEFQLAGCGGDRHRFSCVN